MGSSLLSKIQDAIGDERIAVSAHAANQLRARQIAAWQIVSGLEGGRLLRERPHSKPNPVVEVEQLLPDGTAVKVVWAWLAKKRLAILVTVHLFDE